VVKPEHQPLVTPLAFRAIITAKIA